MHTLTSKVVATGVIVATLLAAGPAFADSGRDENTGLHLGVFAKVLKENRQDRREDRRDTRHSTSTAATSTKQFTVEGTITFISGTTLTVQGGKGAVYTVNAGGASVVGHDNVSLTFSALAVNDKVQVKGSLVNNVIVATRIKDKSDATGKTAKTAKVHRSVEAGIVNAINGSIFTIANFGSSGNTTVTTNGSTKYFVQGSATTSAALTNGAHVLVLGTSSATSTSSVNASIVVILTEGLNWIKRLWH